MMKVPLLDLEAQYRNIKKEIDETVLRVIGSQKFILSEEVKALEEEVAAYSGTKYAAGVASGTDALILSLVALGIGRGDEVITTPFTFMATAEAISTVGARPVFVDIDPETYNIDVNKVEEYLKSHNAKVHGPSSMVHCQQGKVKAIMPVHLYGQCADIERIMGIAREYGLKVIEDTAQAIGAAYKGKKAGSFSDAGCLSFFPSKNLGGFGDGGMIISDNRDFIEHIKSLRVHGSKVQYIHEELGYNSRLDSLQAAVLRVKLRYLDKWLEGRRSIAAKYDSAFKGLPIRIPKVSPGNVHTYHQYTIAVNNRDGLRDFLEANGIGARVYYPVPLYSQRCYAASGYDKKDYPVSERLSGEIISLPVYPELSGEGITYVISKVTEFTKKGV
jgi:dTDP-4-amino-4,6-dideoxygalactose transaminase